MCVISRTLLNKIASNRDQLGELEVCVKKQYKSINSLDGGIAEVTDKLDGDLNELQECLKVIISFFVLLFSNILRLIKLNANCNQAEYGFCNILHLYKIFPFLLFIVFCLFNLLFF